MLGRYLRGRRHEAKGKRVRGVVPRIDGLFNGILGRGQEIPASPKVGRVNKARGWPGRPGRFSPAPFIVQSDEGHLGLPGHWS